MKKIILVPTDLSANSRAGIRFAIQTASQTRDSLVFFYCIEFLKPTRWSDSQYDSYLKKELDDARDAAVRFVADVYEKAGLRSPRIKCVVRQSAEAGKAIIEYAKEINAAAICMSTRGAGRFKKLIGNHASAIITRSPVPAFVIPKTYRRAPVRHIVYSSDLNNVAPELKQVKDLAKRFKAKVSVLHYDYLADVQEARLKLEKVAARYETADVKFHFEKLDLTQPLSKQLLKDIGKYKASLAVLFTDQKRGWFDKLFLSSKSTDVEFDSRIPLLVIPKSA
ncbi:MAG TPA: universal stress protein [Chryseosolibacter sp.]